MFFNLAQTFYVDKSLVQNADDIIITSVDLYFKSKPKATNNKSGIEEPGVSVLLADVMEDGVPDIKNTYAISDRWAHVEYQNIAVSTTAATKTNFLFTKPIIVQTNKSYAIVVCYDGNEDFILWSAKEGDQILGTNKPAPGSFAKNVGNYYEPVSQPSQSTGQEAYDWESSVAGAPGGLTNGIWKPLKDLDLKFNAYCGRFHNSGNSGANTFTGNNFIVKNHHEYVVFDRASSYAIKGGRYDKEGGQSNGIVTVGWREKFKPGELVYQVTPLVPGTISVNSKSRVITSDGSINFNSLYGATANQDLFIILVSNNYMNADSRNFNSRPKYKYPTGGTFYDPYRSDTDVRKIISIDSNTQITIDNNPTFSDPNARMSVSPVAEFDFFDYHHHKIPDWDVDWWRFDKKRRKRYGTMFLRDSNANSTLRFVNNTIEYVSINTPPVSFNDLFTIANGVSNSSISYDIAYAGNSTFVAVGANQSIQISNDLGVTWTAGSSNSTAATAKLRLYSVAYGNSVYFAVGEKGLIYRSTNALTWTLPSSPQTDSKYTLYGAAYGDGKYVAVGKNKNDSYIINSSDANTWTNRSNSSIDGKLYGVTFGNSVFVAVGEKDFARSIDGGDTWSKVSRAAGSDGKFFDVAYGNGVFVAVGKGGIQTSPTGSSWTKRTIAGIDFSPYIFSVAYGNGSFVAVGGKGSKNPGYVLVSNNNGVDWTSRSFPLDLAKYRDKQNLAKKIAYGNSIFVAAIMATYREMDDDDDKSYGQFIYANSTAINTRIPGSNTDVGSVTGTGYSNNDRIEVYCTNSVYTVKNAYANVITDGSGAISNTRIYSPGHGFPSDGNGVTYKIWNNSNALSSGTGANLHFSVGASLRTEHSGLVYSNVSIVNLEIHKVIPKIRHSHSKHQKDIVFKFNTPWYLDATDDEIKFGNGASHPTPNGGVIISTVANTYLNQTNTLIIMSRSNEIAVQAGLGNNSQNNYTGIGSNSISNNDFSVDVPIDYGIYTGTYDVNNLDAFENTRYGQARAKHISTKVSFAKDQAAEDLVVYMRAHRPVGTDIKVYAKVYNKDDEDAFDDKDWTLLEYKVNGDVFSSETNVNDMAEYQLGFSSSPNTYYVGTGVVTTNSSTIIVGSDTDFNGEFNEGDLIKISSPLFPNNYQIAVVNSVSNDTYMTLNDPITATGIATASGLNISFLGGKRPDFIRPLAISPPPVDPSWFTGRPSDLEGYPYQAFNNVNGNNVVRYYNQQMVPFDTFTTFQLKIVMISPNPSIVPMLEDIRAIGVSV